MNTPNKTIIFASPVTNFFGGAERSMYQLILNAKRHGYTPIVIVPRLGEISKQLKKDDIKVYSTNFDWWARGPKDFKINFKKYRSSNGDTTLEMARIIQKERPLACVSYTAVFPWLAYAASISNTPHIWQVCEMLDDANQWRLRLPIQETMNVLSNLSVKLFANSTATKEHLLKYIPRHKNSIDVIYPYINQVSVVKQSSSEPSYVPKSKYTICLVGNIQPSKGQLDAVMALGHLKDRGVIDAKLVLVGKEMDLKYSKVLKSYISTHNLTDDVVFTGYTTNPHIYTKAATISLVCSPHEAFGRITIEALAIGTPVIGADTDGTKEILHKDGLYGLLYTPSDSQQLSEKIERLLNDRKLQLSLSKSGQRYARDKFTLDNNQKLFFDYISSLKDSDDSTHMPLSDIVIAHSQRNKALSRENKHLQEENKALIQQLTDIKSSKKYILAEKMGNIIRVLKNN